MNEFIRRSQTERAAVFEETAARLGIGRPAIVEKDFWVCWTLAQLFGPDGPADVTHDVPMLLFKGGTSLSKVYGLIDRFSEDVDLTVDRQLLVAHDADPDESDIGARERKRRIDAVVAACIAYVHGTVQPFLLSRNVGSVSVDTVDPQTLEFSYPRALADSAYGGEAYVNPSIRLEFGARGDIWPAQIGHVTAYAAEVFPELFTTAPTAVRTLSAERTFWEKATILHAIASREHVGDVNRQSRHYSDLARMAASSVGSTALEDTRLLLDVARHKTRYFTSAGARYNLARPGTLRLVPSAAVRAALTRDYDRMREMFISEPPSFAQVMAVIASLEARINGSTTTQ
jgi:hypothetical protein